MNIEEELRSALERADAYPPSADLFARLTGSLEDDAHHRSRTRRTVLGIFVGCLTLIGWFAATGSVVDGRILVPGWALEAATTAVMAALVASLGPALRRFGASYLTGALGTGSQARFAALLDIAYYLVCTGYVLLTTELVGDMVATPVAAEHLARASWRVGGLALLMGVGHTATLLSLPVIGLFLRSVRWHESARVAPDPRAAAADRIALVILGVLALGGAFVTLLVVIQLGLVGLDN